jgi:hypothetical protein
MGNRLHISVEIMVLTHAWWLTRLSRDAAKATEAPNQIANLLISHTVVLVFSDAHFTFA